LVEQARCSAVLSWTWAIVGAAGQDGIGRNPEAAA
jgi:hypothetical protein